MKIRGDAARLTIDGISWPAIALRAVVLAAIAAWVLDVYLGGGTFSPFLLLIVGAAAIWLRRAFTGRPRLVLDRTEGEMVLTRGGEEIRRPLSALREARVQTYEPDPRFRGGKAGVGLERMALLTDQGMLPFEFAYRRPERAKRLAEAVNGWLGG